MDDVAKQVIQMTNECETTEELYFLLNSIAYTLGGLVCHFVEDDRAKVAISLTESVGMGLINTSKSLGYKQTVEMVVGQKSK